MNWMRVVAITVWLTALMLAVALADRIGRVKEAVAAMPSLRESSAELRTSINDLDHGIAALASRVATPAPPPSASLADAGRIDQAGSP
jgi:hypothetical protein